MQQMCSHNDDNAPASTTMRPSAPVHAPRLRRCGAVPGAHWRGRRRAVRCAPSFFFSPARRGGGGSSAFVPGAQLFSGDVEALSERLLFRASSVAESDRRTILPCWRACSQWTCRSCQRVDRRTLLPFAPSGPAGHARGPPRQRGGQVPPPGGRPPPRAQVTFDNAYYKPPWRGNAS